MKALYLLLETFAVVIVFLAVTTAANAAISDGFDYPVGKPDGNGYKNSQDFGEYNSDFDKYHLGEDWNGIYDVDQGEDCNSDEGKPVYAISNGMVGYADYYSESWGNIITIHHALPTDEYGGVVESFYAHLGTVLVSDGDIVTRGQKIGTIGKTGTSAGDCAHLHFELRSDESIAADHGYSISPKPEGWLDPSDFIDSHSALSPGTVHATDVRFGAGTISYVVSDGSATVDSSQIDNYGDSESDWLSLRLKACNAPTLPAECDLIAQLPISFDGLSGGSTWGVFSRTSASNTPPDGIYYIILELTEYDWLKDKQIVRDYRTFPGKVTINGVFDANDSVDGDDFGDSFADADSISRDSTTDGAISSWDEDFFRIKLTKYGKLELSTKGTTDTKGSLFREDGALLVVADDNCVDGINFCIKRKLDPGTYYLKVEAPSTSLYRLKSEFKRLIVDDFGNTMEKAYTISLNSITDGSIDYKDDVDYFRVQLTEYGKLEMRTKGAIDTKGFLYKKNGTLLVTADDNCSDGINFCIKRKLRPGTYYLKVKASSKGSYKLKSEFTQLVADDFGNSIGKAHTIAPDSITDGTISTGKDVDYFKFRMSRNGYIGLVNNHNTAVMFELLKKSGDKIRSRVCDIYAGSPCLAQSLKEGTYYIKVSGYRGATGPYIVGLVAKYGNFGDISY